MVFATRALQFPPLTGAQLRTQRLLAGLAKHFDVCVVTFSHDPQSDEGRTDAEEIERAFPAVRVITVPGLGRSKRLSQARTLVTRRSWSHGRYVSGGFRAALVEAVTDSRVNIIHFDDLGTSLNGPVERVLNAVAPHNIERRIVAEVAARSSGARRLFAEIEQRKLQVEEPAAWRRMDVCVAISPVEGEAMADAGARRVLLAPNGADPVQRRRLQVRRHGEPLRLLFVGTGSFQPNEHGLAWVAEEVLPKLEPDTWLLDVVGELPRNPRRRHGITYHGRVPEVAPFYERAHVAIVPVHFGGGSRLKTVEAMAFGLPVVATGVGAEGLPVRGGVHYMHADEAEDFVRALEMVADRLAGSPAEIERMVSAARAAVEPLFWPAIAANLASSYSELIESSRQGGATASSGAGRRRRARHRR